MFAYVSKTIMNTIQQSKATQTSKDVGGTILDYIGRRWDSVKE